MSKRKLKQKIKDLRVENYALVEGVKNLDSMNAFLEQTLQSCESACTYHQERSEKAFEIIGRFIVESELDAKAI